MLNKLIFQQPVKIQLQRIQCCLLPIPKAYHYIIYLLALEFGLAVTQDTLPVQAIIICKNKISLLTLS